MKETTTGDGGTTETTPEKAQEATPEKAQEPTAEKTPESTPEPVKETPPEPIQETPTDQPPTKGSGEVTGAKAASSNARAPLDAMPSPDGSVIYYTAYKPENDATTQARNQNDPGENLFGKNDGALYSVPAAGGQPKQLADGFWAPTGLVVSKDGSKVYVADSNVSNETNPDEVGAIYVVDSAGGTKTMLNGTKGYKPKSLDIVMEATEQLYFTGVDKTSGNPGVFRVPVAGGTVSTVYTPGASDDFFKDPGGIAVAADRTIYVAETIGGMGGNTSAIIQIKGGKATEFVTGIKVGYPAGAALSHDEKFLLVSGIDRNKRTSVLYRIDLSDPKQLTQITKDIDGNSNSAGLHRAHNTDIYAWANAAFPDENGQNGGAVYLLNTKASP